MPKEPDTWGARNPLAGLMQPASVDDQQSSTPSVLDLISGKRKDPRDRDWEKRNRAYSYIVPAPLRSVAIQVREDLLSIAQFGEDGKPRGDRTTVDDVATILMDWALTEIQKKPGLLAPRTNPRSRKGHLTLSWEGWDQTPIELKKPVRRQDKKEKPSFLSFRWGPEIDARVKKLAGAGAPGGSAKNPIKFAIPVGDLVVSLLQLAVNGYRTRQFRLNVGVTAVSRVDSWERP